MKLDQAGIHQVLSGADRSAAACLLRGATTAAEPFYRLAMRLRNVAYDRGWLASHALPGKTISVGNLTTGGTGKTPVVLWLAERLRESGRRPAVLMRGYRPTAAGVSDEQQMLTMRLNTEPGAVQVPVIANPDRLAGAQQALAQLVGIDTFLLDDGFQHRRVRRDFDLVLINATQPFGFDHGLPRGLLREPPSGLERAHAVLITRASQVSAAQLAAIEQTVRRHNPIVPIFHADHEHAAVRDGETGARQPLMAMEGERLMAFGGIGDPDAFLAQLRSHGWLVQSHHWFRDHHAYSPLDRKRLSMEARLAGATRLLTTEKDWVKIAPLHPVDATSVPIWVVELAIRFWEDDEQRLLSLILGAIHSTPG